LGTGLLPYHVEAVEWALEALEERSGAVICLCVGRGPLEAVLGPELLTQRFYEAHLPIFLAIPSYYGLKAF